MQIGNIQKPRLPGLDSDTDSRLAGAKRAAERGDAKETARQFETLIGMMLVRELRRSMPKGLFGDGAGADIYEGWFDQQLGDTLAERDALGIAGMVKTSLGRAQAALESTPQSAQRERAELGAPVQPAPVPLAPLQPLPAQDPLEPELMDLAPARPGPMPLAPVQRVSVLGTTEREPRP